MILYEGPSRIDGKPVVAIATGLASRSGNPKTGAMVQTWIIRADVHPVEAVRTGADASICGGCVHRGRNGAGRSCYVRPHTAPTAVWRHYRRGGYRRAELAELAGVFAGRRVRLGAYGDPAAVPVEVWEQVVSRAASWTGYTHQWRSPRLRDVLRYCQVSADSLEDAERASAAGVGSFRVLRRDEKPAPFEVTCPASKEAGYAETCASCGICSGWSGRNVAIQAHGYGFKNFERRSSAQTRRIDPESTIR